MKDVHIDAEWEAQNAFLALNSMGGIGQMLREGMPLKELRAMRRTMVAPLRRMFVGKSSRYDEFVADDRHRNARLLDTIPIRVVVNGGTFHGLDAVSISDPNTSAPAIELFGNAVHVVDSAYDMLASEFADDMATVLGDTSSVRMFAYRVLRAANKFDQMELVRPAKMATPKIAKARLIEIAEVASKMVKLMKEANEARGLIERAHHELGLANPDQKIRRKEVGLEVRESKSSLAIRVSDLDWLQVRHVMEAIAADAQHAASQIVVKKGRNKNEGHGFTGIALIAEAWNASFGKAPGSSPDGQTARVLGYCHLLFSFGPVDVKRGLAYWKATRAKVSQHERIKGFNPFLAGSI